MHITYHRQFQKDIKTLSAKEQEQVKQAIQLFLEHPFHPRLRNHALKGTMKDYRSFSAGFNIRIIYKEDGHHTIILFLRVGTHAKVYKASF